MTVDERNEYRAKMLAKCGLECAIPEDVADAIRARVADGYVILTEEFTGPRLTFHINPRMDVSTRARYDIESELMRTYGNAPHCFYTDFTAYRLTFHVN